MASLHVADYINAVSDGKTQRALQALFESIITEVDTDESGWSDLRGNDAHLKSTGVGALGPTLKLEHDSASPANSDVIGRLTFYSDDSGGASAEMARIDVVVTDVTAASEDVDLKFYNMVAGTLTEAMAITSTGLTVKAGTTPLNLTGAFTTGITIAADGTTAISVTNAFTGVTGISFAGTASSDGILISGACADAIHISGTNTVSGLHISGDQVLSILIDVDAAVTAAMQVKVDDSMTADYGIDISRTGTTGICTTGIRIDTDGTTAIDITSGFTGTTGLLLAGTATNGISLTGACATAAISISGAEAIGLSILTSTPTDGINIAAACANGIAIGGANTTAGINITGAEAVGIQIATSTPVDGILISAACADGIQLSGANTANAINISGASTLNAITISGTSGDTGIEISGTATNFAIDISGAQTAVGLSVSGACATGISISGACSTAVMQMGSTGTPLVNDTAIAGFVLGYFDSGVTSGWPCGAFFNTNVTAAGGSFTALQGDAVLTAAKATVTGVENWMQVNTGGRVTGACRSLQGTIDFSNEDKGSGGVYSGACLNIKGEGAACDIGTTQRVSCLELKTEGTWSAAAGEDFDTKAAGYAIYFNGFTAAAGVTNILSSTRLAELPASTIGIRVGVGADGASGAAYYIPLVLASEWN